MGTANRPINVTMSYITIGFLGFHITRDSYTIMNNESWGNPYYYDDLTMSCQLNNVAFVWANYNSSSQGYIKLITTGADNAFLFRIYDAEFNFSNY